ncbi:MAG: type II toxin-antitoxin system PemK/MazF family toxin [Gammaproteobacteria bacterium]|nr:type II toxin-antitoxin system PemK/MazF family toxin [Gammaproteobacteria bacterium]MBU1654240.1 type II toxin-antitoxin system PemK/MazF family toxin [Gammaproteobacteria bacterium]
MYQPSDVVLLPFPFSDLSAHKKRPVLILKAANIQGDFLAAQITSQPGYEGALVLEQADFSIGLLPKRSFVRPDKLVTLNQSLVIQRIGMLTDAAIARIRESVCAHLDCR